VITGRDLPLSQSLQGTHGPLFIGKKRHARFGTRIRASALEVLVAHGIDVMIDQ
jgi:phosphoglucomutase